MPQKVKKDEKYLDKFVDIRLGLNPNDESMKGAIYDLTMDLPLKIPYGDGYEFRLEHAAELAGQLAVQSKLSMRKIKRILLRVELAMRCYADRPLDASLLVLLAFQTELKVI